MTPKIKFTFGILDVKQLLHEHVQKTYTSITPKNYQTSVTHRVTGDSVTFEVEFVEPPRSSGWD